LEERPLFSSGNRVSWAGSLSPICNEKIDWFTAFIHESTCLSLVGLYLSNRREVVAAGEAPLNP